MTEKSPIIKLILSIFPAFIIFLILFSGIGTAANTIVVEDLSGSVTAEDLVNILLGENSNVTVSNITVTGSNLAIGNFTNGDTLGFDTGVVLTSGLVSNVSKEMIVVADTNHTNPGDANLSALVNDTTFDAIVLEFDFVPEKSGISFKYRFSSDEYFDDEFDDAFGLFVNGENIALLPDGNPVSVLNINGSDYYVSDPLNNCFNGSSVILRAEATVTPDTLNHMKFAIADMRDGIYDSAVFIEGGSFVSNSDPNAPVSLLCEGEVNPTAISDFTPEFSWTFSDPDGTDIQGAYQIIVGTTEDGTDKWDSGKVTSSSSTNISYAGSALGLGTTYHWKVNTWDNQDAESAYCADQTFEINRPVLTIDGVTDIIQDWGQEFDLNHSVTVADANASSVNLSYNTSWLSGSDLGAINEGDAGWCNQTISNSTVQLLTVRINTNSTDWNAVNGTETFQINITKRDIVFASEPGVSQTVNPDATFWINSSAQGEYAETFVGNAVLLKDGTAVGAPQAITDGNANFSMAENSPGTYDFSIKFYNLTYYNNASTSVSSVKVNGPSLTIGGVTDITQDWGQEFGLNHSVTVADANASNVDLSYDLSWLAGSDLGAINKGDTGWYNQTISNSTVQLVAVKVNVNSTDENTVNGTGTFQVNITKRDVVFTSEPAVSQTVDPDATFWINASAQGEYAETFVGNAVLLKDGIVVGAPQTITDGNANFSITENSPGAYDFSIRFYNLTHYNNASTSISSVNVNGPSLTIGGVTDIIQDWGQEFGLNHSVTVADANASNVNLSYDLSWLAGSDLGAINKGDTGWYNQTISNSTVQLVTVKVNANSTDANAVNDTGTFQINITNRDIVITSDPIISQSFNPGATFWINASAQGEYAETFMGNAVLLKDGASVGAPQVITDGNANFSMTENSPGTYDFSIRFYNLTYYNNATTSDSVVAVSNPVTDSSGIRVYVSPSQSPENVESTETSVKYVMGGTKVEYDLSGGEAPVIGISFDAKDNEGAVVAKVQLLKSKPDDVTSLPSNSYKLMSINVGSEGTISEHNAEDILIHFKVSWEWINDNGIDPSTIRLTRFHGGKWNDLPTSQMDENGEFLYFTAETPGFSIFSVVGDSVEEIAAEGENKSEVSAEEKTDTAENKKTPGFTAPITLVLVVFTFLIRRKFE